MCNNNVAMTSQKKKKVRKKTLFFVIGRMQNFCRSPENGGNYRSKDSTPNWKRDFADRSICD